MATSAEHSPFPGVPPPLLVGREREQALLRAQLAAALAGRGGLVLIGGEAGIGKTALAEALAREATAHGALAVTGRCYDLAETPPYGPWLEIFERYPAGDGLPPLPPVVAQRGTIGPADSQAALVRELRDFFAAVACQRPLLLVLDDLHWADPASLDLLRILARDLAALPLVLLAIYRSDEVADDHPLHRLLPALVRESALRRLDLRPLDADAIEALVAARYRLAAAAPARLVAWLMARGEGNPFVTGELLRALEGEGVLHPTAHGWALGDLTAIQVPPLLRQMIAGRLARLGEAARDLLAVAAVIGQEVPLALWATVAAVEEATLLDVIEHTAAAHLAEETPDGTRVRFTHALIREVLYEGLRPSRRREWHRRVGAALAALPYPDPDAVAYHFRQAGDERAAAWLIQAGDRARCAQAMPMAIERYAAALAFLEQRDAASEDRAWLHYTLAQLRRWADPGQAMADLDAAAALAAAVGDQGLAIVSELLRGLIHCQVGELRCGVAALVGALTAMDGLTAAELARITRRAFGEETSTGIGADAWWWGVLPHLVRTGRYAEALTVSARLPAQPPPAAGKKQAEAYGNACVGLGLAHAMLGQPGLAPAALARAQAGYRATGWIWVFGNLALAELDVLLAYRPDQVAERRRLVAEVERAWAPAEGMGPAGPPFLGAVPILLVEGGWTEARRLALAGCAAGHQAAVQQQAASWLARLARLAGEAALAWDLVRAVHPAGPATEPGDHSFVPAVELQRLAAQRALEAGDLPTAQAWLAAHDRWLAWSGAVLGQAEGQLGWAAYHRAAGCPALAQGHAEQALAHATEPRQPLALLAAHRLLGELATEAGRHGEAQTHLDAALALADASAAPYERALTLLALADQQAATGDQAAAQVLLDEIRAICAPLAATIALARADTLAVRLAAAAAMPTVTPPTRPAYPAGLTAREVEVLRLVAAGLTNSQVAARLFVTPRTVNAHLTSIYTKLGVAGRAAAIRFALDHDLG